MAMFDSSQAAGDAAANVPPPSSEELRGYPLGTLVYRSGLLPLQTVNRALGEAEDSGRRLGEVLLEHGLPERELSRLLAAQRGQDFIDLTQYPIDYEVARLLPHAVAELYHAVPVGREEESLLLAVADHDDEAALAHLRQTLPGSIRVVIAPRVEIDAVIARAHESQPRGPETVAAVGELLSAVRQHGTPAVRLRRADFDDGSIVECDVYPVGEGAGGPQSAGPFPFRSADEAKAFVETALLALQVLGCDAAWI
jgi:Type II secretion system (T2SS), protein E, N-terminal domain